MKNYREVLEQFLSKERGSSLTIKQMTGSSDSTLFLVDKEVYRVGPKEDVATTMLVYSRFKHSFSNYGNIFPWIELIVDADTSIARMEYVGSLTLEELILQMKGTKKEILSLGRFNREVLKHLRAIHTETSLRFNRVKNLEQSKFFLDELINALSINFKRAGLRKEVVSFLEILKDNSDAFNQVVSSLAHKDFSVGNIIISNKDESVKFIDPRIAIPYAMRSSAMGNVAVDITGYLVSIERKEMELQRERPSTSLKFIKEEIECEIKRYYNERVFSPVVLKACMVLWYSVYSACKCEYCTAPERVWLYDNMVQRLRIYLTQEKLEA